MARRRAAHFAVRAYLAVLAACATAGSWHAARADAPLPGGVKAVWDLDKAWRAKTPTRERICLDGLWRWQPATAGPAGRAYRSDPNARSAKSRASMPDLLGATDAVPIERWGYFKVPGCWPGITDYMQKDCQTVYADPAWKNDKLSGLTAAWYQREFTVPGDWAGRRIALEVGTLNSYAAVWVDGKKVGEMHFPGGELDLSSVCRAGENHVLSMQVVAMPLKGVMLSYSDSASAREVKGSVARRGLCGDVYLTSAPPSQRIDDVRVAASVRRGEIAFDVALQGLPPRARFILRAEIRDGNRVVAELASDAFTGGDLKAGRFAFTAQWKAPKLWDIHTPGNQYDAQLSLLTERAADARLAAEDERSDANAESGAGGAAAPTPEPRRARPLDVAEPVRFGFREFWIDGRDFYLNGSRIYLSCVPLDNAQISAGLATYEAAKESLLRLKGFGINFVYTHNYGCEPGTHLAFGEILRAADDVGMLVSFSQPHFGQYEWKAPDADANNGYARHAEFYVREAGSHPAVVMYSMSHNATGYAEDMNPDLIDGLGEPRDQWALNNAKLALRAEAIVKRLDGGRLVYHHASGNLGSMDAINFYPNWAPIQEMSDWFEHWASKGVKPAFTCEYGAPFTWDWTMYRGWYKGERTFGSANVPWEFCFAEWNSQFLGDRAFKIGEPEKANLRWENKQFRAGKLWHRWDYPYEVGSAAFDDRYEVFAQYISDNWPAFRTWGASAISPWEYGHFWRLRPGVDRNRRVDLKVDWDRLQRPGFSADYIQDRYERMDLAYERKDWEETPAARALIRTNGPVLAYIAGKEGHFTEKGHNFLPGEKVDKQLVLINNSRQLVSYDPSWSVALSKGGFGGGGFGVRELPTGDQKRIPMSFQLPDDEATGKYEITASNEFGSGQTQKDTFTIHVLPPHPALEVGAKIALYDPKGETGKWLAGVGVRAQGVEANAELAGYDVLVIGKGALTVDGPAPDISRVRDGLKVIVFEQSADVLQKRLGFRATEYGLRQAFVRVPDHPVLAGLSQENLRDWRGAATNTPPRLSYTMRPMYGPTVKWCDLDVTRVWRCGNWGSVASVLIEKPARGDFLPIVDGGFSLQYSPLMEFHEGHGMILFCQLDVTGRTEGDPAAERIARNLLQYASDWKFVERKGKKTEEAKEEPKEKAKEEAEGKMPSPRAGETPATRPLGATLMGGTPMPRAAAASRKVFYAGEAAGKEYLAKMGVPAGEYDGGVLPPDGVLVVGPGGGKKLAESKSAVADFLKAGGRILAIGLDEGEARALLPSLPPAEPITMKKAEHIAAFFAPPSWASPLAGVGPADVHDRAAQELSLVTGGGGGANEGGVAPLGGGVLAAASGGQVVFCQLVPWQFDYAKQYNLKRTFRRASFLVARLLAGVGASGPTPLIERFGKSPVAPGAAKSDKRWLDGLYLDVPEEMDDPYRFFRW